MTCELSATLALAGRDAEAARDLRAAVRVYPKWTQNGSRPWSSLPENRPEPFAEPARSRRARISPRPERGQPVCAL